MKRTALRKRRERITQRRLERAIDLDDVNEANTLCKVLGEDADATADLEHDVLRPRARRRAR